MQRPSLKELKNYGYKAIVGRSNASARFFLDYERTRVSTEPPTRLVRFMNRHGHIRKEPLRAWNVYGDYWLVENYAYAKPAEVSVQSAHELLVLECVTFTEDDIEILPELVHAVNCITKKG